MNSSIPSFQQNADDEFLSRVIPFLREKAAQATNSMNDDELKIIAKHGIAVAKGYELVSEIHLVNFILNMLTIHPKFHEQPQIYAVLCNLWESPETRMDAILDRKLDMAWEEAAAYPDAQQYWEGLYAKTK